MATDLNSFASEYQSHLSQRQAQGIPPLPLSADQAAAVCSALQQKDLAPGLLEVHGQADTVGSLRYLISERVPPGVYPASKVKAEFLADVALGRASSPHLEKMETLEMLAAMGGGYNISPLIEVFTLDSSTCPACGYMKLAAERAVQELGDTVEMVEYKITTPENIARMKKLSVQNLPSILINGQLRFSSIIPSNRELLETIQEYK